jgi:antitoxin component YwqK of YwqJK toxin-antitoxin module
MSSRSPKSPKKLQETKEDLQTYIVAELREIAKSKGIKGYYKLKKAELIDAIIDAENKIKITTHKINDTTVSKDVIENIIAGYLDYREDIPYLELILEKKISDKDRYRVGEKISLDKSIKTLTTYLDNKKIRKQLFHRNDKPVYDISYKNDKYEGLYIQYNAYGKVLEEKNFKNNKLQGIYKRYDNDNELVEQSNYINGKLNGISKEWYHASLYKEKHYKDGKLNGINKEWYRDTTVLKSEENYINNKKDGLQLYYDKNGKLIKQLVYKNGKKILNVEL